METIDSLEGCGGSTNDSPRLGWSEGHSTFSRDGNWGASSWDWRFDFSVSYLGIQVIITQIPLVD